MEKYGLERIKTQNSELSGRFGMDMKKEEETVARAMNNDYDLRESMRYGRDSGHKYFKDLEEPSSVITTKSFFLMLRWSNASSRRVNFWVRAGRWSYEKWILVIFVNKNAFFEKCCFV